ncbi:MAG: CzcE family metal-binding protein [Caldimonas sp.]
MRAIFISYRRDDTEGYAGRLFQDLREKFGKDAVFMDVAGIEPGRDFRRVIEQQVASCGVLLAVIGKSWLTVADEKGKHRLDDPYDFVRLETASALKRDIPVIPVLVQQAEMPRAEQLPDDLKDLAFRNSVELSHARWESDVDLLIAALGRYIDPSGPTVAAAAPAAPRDAPASRHPAWVIAPLATLAFGGIGYGVWDRLHAGADETKGSASTATRIGPASAPGPAPAPLVAAAPAPLHAPASAPPIASARAPLTAAASAPPLAPAARVPVAPGVRRPAAEHPVAPAPARHVDRPVLAKAPVPAPALVIARPPAAAPATTSTSVPARVTPVESVAAAPLPMASVGPAPAAAESPVPDVAPARRDPSLDLLGGPGSPSTVTRTIVIKPDTSYVNVTGGEVIRFEVGNKSFVWNFSGLRSSFDLARVAPPSVLDRKVTAYVAPNPLYPRRR